MRSIDDIYFDGLRYVAWYVDDWFYLNDDIEPTRLRTKKRQYNEICCLATCQKVIKTHRWDNISNRYKRIVCEV